MSEKRGVIYIFTNPSFPKFVKIGYARDVYERLKQLNRSEAVPYAFRAYAVYEVNEGLMDRDLHHLIDELNKDLRAVETFAGKTRTKEFYEMSPEDAYRLLERIARISGTMKRLKRMKDTGDEELEERIEKEIEEDKRRAPFSFEAISIEPGSQIAYIADPSITATVVNDRKISYQGKETSLSALAAHLTGRSSVAGPLFFTYKGKVLADIRNKKEGHVGARGKGRSLKPVKPSAVMVIEETPPEKKVKKPRLTPFRFGACGIAPGSEIAFIRDPAVVATVVDDRSIRYRGELTSLSALACKLTGRTAAQGPIFFTYKGKVLSDIRRQKEGRREEDTGEKAAQPEVAQVDKQPMKTQEVQTEKERKRAPFRFSACGIAPGSEIAYIRDPEVVATVVDYRNIRYRGELTSLSALACKLTGRTSAAGPLFFTYKGKVLADIRLEIEGEEA